MRVQRAVRVRTEQPPTGVVVSDGAREDLAVSADDRTAWVADGRRRRTRVELVIAETFGGDEAQIGELHQQDREAGGKRDGQPDDAPPHGAPCDSC